MNAREEFLRLVRGKDLECATILYSKTGAWFDTHNDEEQRVINLRQDYTEQEYKEFLDKLNFEYDDGYGNQELFGTVWFKDGAWAEREEYDGSEWWSTKSRPEIPETLKK